MEEILFQIQMLNGESFWIIIATLRNIIDWFGAYLIVFNEI